MTDLALPFTPLDALDALAQALAPRIAEINREREDDRFLGYAASADFLGSDGEGRPENEGEGHHRSRWVERSQSVVLEEHFASGCAAMKDPFTNSRYYETDSVKRAGTAPTAPPVDKED